MRVGIDVRKLGDGGIGTYLRETITALAEIAPGIRFVAFGGAGQRSAFPLADAEWVAVEAGKYSIAEHVTLPRAVRRARVDLFHAPHYVLPLGLDVPSVVTVHDLIHVLLPRTPLHPLYARWMIRSACRRAVRVVTVSETTAASLRSEIDVPGEKIRVVPNGVSAAFRKLPRAAVDAVLERLGIARPYVLFVGNRLPHKNVETLVRAWAGLAAPRPGLVLCGEGYGPGSPVRAVAREAGADAGLVAVGPTDTETLVALYNGAELFVSASLYEGFGLPVVEAFACGTPVLATAAGAVPEVAGGAAELVPPQRVDMLRDGMYRLLRDPRLREALSEKGARRARAFSWQEAARKTLAVYEEVTSARR